MYSKFTGRAMTFLQRSVYRARLKFGAPGLVNFVPAVAYHFCLALPAAVTQPGDFLLAEPCRGFSPHPVTLCSDFYNVGGEPALCVGEASPICLLKSQQEMSMHCRPWKVKEQIRSSSFQCNKSVCPVKRPHMLSIGKEGRTLWLWQID